MAEKAKPTPENVRVIIRVDIPTMESQDIPEVRRAVISAISKIPGAEVELSVLPIRPT
jgi:hypothetical protein